MLGSGIFINIAQLAKASGALSIFAYPIVGLMLLPLIQTFSKLLSFHPGATFFEIGSYVHPLVGFITSWGYFVGKLAAAALGVHIFTTSCGLFFPAIGPWYLLVDIILIGLFGLLIFFSLKTGLPMQLFFLILKLLPLASGIFAGLSLLKITNLMSCIESWCTLPATFPLVLFAFAGFEASCSLGNQIPNAAKNAPRIILFSFLFTLSLVTALQIIFVGALGCDLAFVTDFREPFALIIEQTLGRYPQIGAAILAATITGIASSALGSSYSILSSNIWNLHTLANRNLIPGARFLKKINHYNAPVWVTIVAICIEIAYLIGSNTNIYFLQRISASANVLAYSIGTLAFLGISRKISVTAQITALFASLTCSILIYSIFAEGATFGFLPYTVYALLLLLGLLLHGLKNYFSHELPTSGQHIQ